MPTATKVEAYACQSAHFGAESSEGLVVRQVVTHLNFFGFLAREGAGQKRDMRKSATFFAVR
jgi:hypothetical protein